MHGWLIADNLVKIILVTPRAISWALKKDMSQQNDERILYLIHLIDKKFVTLINLQLSATCRISSNFYSCQDSALSRPPRYTKK